MNKEKLKEKPEDETKKDLGYADLGKHFEKVFLFKVSETLA